MKKEIREILDEIKEAPLLLKIFTYIVVGLIVIVLVFIVTSEIRVTLGVVVIYLIGYFAVKLLDFITKERGD